MRAIIKRLKKFKLFLNLKKYKFLILKIKFLKFLISKKSIYINPRKINFIATWL